MAGMTLRNGSATRRIYARPGEAARPRTSRVRRVVCREKPIVVRGIEIAPRTGPVDVLSGENVVVLSDDENLYFSARDLGYKVSYLELTKRLERATRAVSLHAFFSCSAGDKRRDRYFTQRGWTPHAYEAHTVQGRGGERRRANSDSHILFKAGLLISRTQASTVVICTGDGDLADDLGRFLVELPTPRKLVTLSLAGSTSHRLDARRNDYIADNIELGADCLRPGTATRASKPKPRGDRRQRWGKSV